MPPNLKFSLIPDLQADKCPSGCLQGTNAHVILAQKPSALQKQTVTALSWCRVRHWCHVRVHSFLHTVLKPLTSGEALLQRPSLDGSFPAPDWSPAMHLLLQAHCLSCISWPPAFSIFYFLATYQFSWDTCAGSLAMKSVVVHCLNENQVVKMFNQALQSHRPGATLCQGIMALRLQHMSMHSFINVHSCRDIRLQASNQRSDHLRRCWSLPHSDKSLT